jgi:hypothetical protein
MRNYGYRHEGQNWRQLELFVEACDSCERDAVIAGVRSRMDLLRAAVGQWEKNPLSYRNIRIDHIKVIKGTGVSSILYEYSVTDQYNNRSFWLRSQ